MYAWTTNGKGCMDHWTPALRTDAVDRRACLVGKGISELVTIDNSERELVENGCC